ncbi:peptidoglycan DD-metalloendopeptidase family protein [Cesiribacter sp. SM1]|uniref:peptidoglycan DD-metalloendopeptidase family protein n=1 Tax=Cesiribacter sp. SM1 TaxID=2861196 RepID=UPI001CD4C851|nr:peptidoglycan DD-metalloendopeptidase family protein [Cesiribacter sp. SM1]
MRNGLYLISAILLLLTGCNGAINQVFTSTTPYEAYIRTLEKAELAETPMVQAWIAAGQQVFRDSVIVTLPLSEAGYFSAGEPTARAYHFEVKEGQVLSIAGNSEAEANARLFLDLFVWRNNEWKQVEHSVAAGDTLFQLSYEFDNDTRGLLRLQPELMARVYYTISISPNPALINPVFGATNRSIGSLYGVDRDGGRRSHEGVDIFAPRGTPVIAPTNGFISRVGNNKLGGKVVWMQDQSRGQSYYFAHLDSQLVQSGKRVLQGDTLGLVGNTGNARTTPPHLHFGIYQRGSKDPINYIRTLEAATLSPPLDTALMSGAYELTARQTNLRSGPGNKHLVLEQLPRDTYVKILGQSGDWYRVLLPDQKQGYVSKNLVAPVAGGGTAEVQAAAPLLSEARPDAVPVTYFSDTGNVEVLALYGNYSFVRTADGKTGWVQQP